MAEKRYQSERQRTIHTGKSIKRQIELNDDQTLPEHKSFIKVAEK